jgi:hypothetical protein
VTAAPILRHRNDTIRTDNDNEDRTPRIRMYNVKSNTDAIVQFLNNPWDDPDHDWFDYKELRAFGGLKSGHQLPPGLAVFPAIARDPLIDMIEPGKFDEGGNVYPKKVVAVNAIFLGGVMGEKNADYEPQPGQHIILKFSNMLAQQVESKLMERRDEDPNFDCTLFAWNLRVDVPKGDGGKPAYINSTVRLTKNSEVTPVDPTEPYAIDEILGDMRARVEDAVREINASMASRNIISEPVSVEDPFTDDDMAVEELEKAVAAFGTDATAVDPFDGIADTRLKKLLVDAGVAAPRGASREVLINLANSIGWTSAADLPTK